MPVSCWVNEALATSEPEVARNPLESCPELQNRDADTKEYFWGWWTPSMRAYGHRRSAQARTSEAHRRSPFPDAEDPRRSSAGTSAGLWGGRPPSVRAFRKDRRAWMP